VLYLDLKFCKNLGFSLSEFCEWGTCSTKELLSKRLEQLNILPFSRKYSKIICSVREQFWHSHLTQNYPVLLKSLKTSGYNDFRSSREEGVSPSPILAFKQPKNLIRMLYRAKLPTQNQARRKINWAKPCNEPCNVCS
jgi:hypothetical protein